MFTKVSSNLSICGSLPSSPAPIVATLDIERVLSQYLHVACRMRRFDRRVKFGLSVAARWRTKIGVRRRNVSSRPRGGQGVGAMALMSAADYRNSLRDGRQVWIEGERVPDVTRHAAFQPMIEAIGQI